MEYTMDAAVTAFRNAEEARSIGMPSEYLRGYLRGYLLGDTYGIPSWTIYPSPEYKAGDAEYLGLADGMDDAAFDRIERKATH